MELSRLREVYQQEQERIAAEQGNAKTMQQSKLKVRGTVARGSAFTPPQGGRGAAEHF
jgi:hypothetical protein